MNKALVKHIHELNKQRLELAQSKEAASHNQEAMFSLPEPPPKRRNKPKNAVRIPSNASFAACKYCGKGIYFAVTLQGQSYPLEPLAGFANYGSYHFCNPKREFDKARKQQGRLK